MRPYSFWVYIVASGPCGYLYVGMTNDLVRRVDEHKHGQVDGYSRTSFPTTLPERLSDSGASERRPDAPRT